MTNYELPPVQHSGSPNDVARNLPLKSLSEVQDDSRSTFLDTQPQEPSEAPTPSPESMTLGDLGRALGGSQADSDGIGEEFDPASFLKESAPAAPRKKGANLAAAALNSDPHQF